MTEGYGVRSFMQGAMQGYDFADRALAREDNREEEKRRWGIQNNRAQETHDAQMDKYETEKTDDQRARDIQRIETELTRISAGLDPTEEGVQLLSRPEYAHFNPVRLASDEVGQALDITERTLDPNDPAQINTPEGIEAANVLLGPDVNTDRQGQPLPGKRRIRRIVPGKQPGTIAVDLEVEGEDGQQYSAPLTEKRSADENDMILQEPAEKAIRKVAGVKALRQALTSPQGREGVKKFMRAMGMTSDGEPVKLSLDQRLVSGSGDVLVDADPSAKRNGGGKLPADIQTAEWLRAENKDLSREEALRIVNTSLSDPTTAVVKLAEVMAYSQDTQDLSQEERMRRAEGMIRGIRERMAGKPKKGEPATPAGPQPGTVVDGWRFKGGNPNDPNAWEDVK